MTLFPGSTLGPYTIVSELGRGGMGVVYQAHDPRLDRHIAIKLLPPDLTRDETAKQRFLQEAKAASGLDHPNICTIHEIDETADGQLYLVMAHYEGETLQERILRGPLELDAAIDFATQVGQKLAEATKQESCIGTSSPRPLRDEDADGQDPRLRPSQASRAGRGDADRDDGGHRGLHVTGTGSGP